jgi:putative addiction module component (TIGR02574 family)
MALKPTIDDLISLSPAERILLAEELWDSVSSNPETVPVTDEQREELDRRLQTFRENPSLVVTWDAVKARLDVALD